MLINGFSMDCYLFVESNQSEQLTIDTIIQSSIDTTAALNLRPICCVHTHTHTHTENANAFDIYRLIEPRSGRERRRRRSEQGNLFLLGRREWGRARPICHCYTQWHHLSLSDANHPLPFPPFFLCGPYSLYRYQDCKKLPTKIQKEK